MQPLQTSHASACVRRMARAAIAGIALCVVAGAAPGGTSATTGGGKAPAAATYPADYHPPLPFGKEWIEVTGDGVLRGRYHAWGNWEQEFAAYRADAEAAARARGTPCRKVAMGCVFLKNATITLQDVPGGDGRPMTATFTTPQPFIDDMKTRCMREYSDYMFTWSGGELAVEWVVATVENMHWVQNGPNTEWGCQPKALGEQVLKALEPHKDRGVCMWMFCAGRPETSNPLPGPPRKKERGIGLPPYGISYTQWPLHGGYTLVLSAPEVGLMVHEFNHRYLDNLRTIEGVALTSFHGLSRLGFAHCGFPDPLYHADYRFTYQYIVPRGMWRRFTVTGENKTAREPFHAAAYAWNDVRHDCWFQLPELTDADLARLTGIASVQIAGSRADRREEYRAWIVAPQDAHLVFSPYSARPAAEETTLNNVLQLRSESCAVLQTATGTWLLVKKELADVYADMPQLAGRGGGPLPAYGYVNRDVLPLILLAAPPDRRLPACEEGFFRPAAMPRAK